MTASIVAPCGINCTLCLGFQRLKNKCCGCLGEGEKPHHCTVCTIRSCPEKSSDPSLLCSTCPKYPCKRIKALDKRYRTRYGLSVVENMKMIEERGLAAFIASENDKWKCPQCGALLCMHRQQCLQCGVQNGNFPLTDR